MQGRKSVGIISKIGLRGKLSILIILVLAALSLVLNFYAARNMADAINQEYLLQAQQLASFFESQLIAHTAGGDMDIAEIQEQIENLVAKDTGLQKVSVYAPTREGVTVVASSVPDTIGGLADEDDAAPIFTGDTRFVEKDGGGEEGSGGEEAGRGSGGTGNMVEMLAPMKDADGNNIASIGIYLDTAARDSFILSRQIRFAIISNAGMLLLVAILFFSISRIIVKPVRELTESTRLVGGEEWRQPSGISRHDEVGNLARAFDEMATSLGTREEEVRLLLSASVAVSSELHVDKILQILCEKIAASMKVTYCRIALLDKSGETMVVRAESTTREMNNWDEGVGNRIPLETARYHRQVVKDMKPLILRHDESLKNGDSHAEWEWALTSDTKSALLLPLVSKGEVLGVVTMGEMRRWERSPFTEKKIEFYQILMSQAAVAIENAQLYEKTEWQVRELSIMHRVSQAFTSTLDYQEVVGIVAKRVGSFIGAQYASVLLPDERERYLNIAASYNLSAEYVWTINKKSRISVGKGPIGSAFSQLRHFIVNDVETDESYAPWRHVAKVQGYSSLIALPLVAKGRTIGVICIYFTEPRRFMKNEIDLLTTAANEAAIAIENSQMYENLQDAFVGTIKSLAETIDAKDAYTRGHSEKVSLYSEATARSLGLDNVELETIRYAGYLHDVGKIGIPDAILTKPGKLTVEEFAIIKKHPVLSDRILKPVDFPYPVQPLVRHHHERYDGKGYPDQLAGEEIPLGARILAVADSYEAMTSDRPYRKALSVERALDELVRNKGTQFDPRIVDEFVRIVSAEKPASSRLRKGA